MGSAEKARHYAAVYRQREEALRHEQAKEADRVKALLPEVSSLLRKRFGARRVGWFGSLRTGRLRAESDVDLYVDRIREGAYFEAVDQIIDVLKRQVDLVELEKAPPSLRARIAEDGVELDA